MLTKDIRKVAIYLRVNKIERRLSEDKFNKRFPNYSNMLNQKGIKWAKLLDDAYNSLKFCFGKSLPENCLEKIFHLVNEKDLEKL